jgi:hypothetical protein
LKETPRIITTLWLVRNGKVQVICSLCTLCTLGLIIALTGIRLRHEAQKPDPPFFLLPPAPAHVDTAPLPTSSASPNVELATRESTPHLCDIKITWPGRKPVCFNHTDGSGHVIPLTQDDVATVGAALMDIANTPPKSFPTKSTDASSQNH